MQLLREIPISEKRRRRRCVVNTDKTNSDDRPASTEGMVRHVLASPKSEFVVATETGILHRMKKVAPQKRYFPVSDDMECKYMKMITMEKLLRSLEQGVFEVKVPPEIAEKALLPIQRMVSIG